MKITVNVDGRTWNVEVQDPLARPVVALVEGERFEVWPEEATVEMAAPAPSTPAAPISAAPISAAPAHSAPSQDRSERAVTAPIPGVIVAISAAAGDRVEVGQELCMLEAMKMKNAIRATRAGTVVAVRVAVGEHVRHGQTLFELSDLSAGS